MAKYIVCIEQAEEGGYIVSCPALPGCVTQGETLGEALTMIKDAIAGYITSLEKHGEPIPKGLEEEKSWQSRYQERNFALYNQANRLNRGRVFSLEVRQNLEEPEV